MACVSKIDQTHVKIRYFSVVIVNFLEAATRVAPKNTFFTEHLQTTSSEFLQKDIDKFIDCQTNESTKKIHVQRKKAKHGAERNEPKCQLLKA